jgi:putative hydrolase of HD superfamily
MPIAAPPSRLAAPTTTRAPQPTAEHRARREAERRYTPRVKTNESLLATLLELQILDRVPRSGWMLRGVAEPESVSEHAWHVVLLVWALGPRVPGLDLLRALELAIVHDLAEVRLGDLPRTAARYLPAGIKHAAEQQALAELLAPLGGRGAELYAEYRAKQSVEARFVGACDKLQLLLKVSLYEGWGAGGLGEFWENPENFPDAEFAPVAEVVGELRERRRMPPPSLP